MGNLSKMYHNGWELKKIADMKDGVLAFKVQDSEEGFYVDISQKDKDGEVERMCSSSRTRDLENLVKTVDDITDYVVEKRIGDYYGYVYDNINEKIEEINALRSLSCFHEYFYEKDSKNYGQDFNKLETVKILDESKEFGISFMGENCKAKKYEYFERGKDVRKYLLEIKTDEAKYGWIFYSDFNEKSAQLFVYQYAEDKMKSRNMDMEKKSGYKI